MKRILFNNYRIILIAMLLCCMASMEAWGQVGTVKDDNLTPDNVVEEVLYVQPGTSTKVILQLQGGMPGTGNYWNTDNIDGYIRWYSTVGTSGPGTIGITAPSKANNTNLGTNPKILTKYTNGYAWHRTDFGGTASSDAACWITCNFTSQQLSQGVTLVCEGSSTAAYTQISGYRPYQKTNLVPRNISVRRIYHVKDASERAAMLMQKKNSFDELKISLNDNNSTSLSALLRQEDKSRYLMQDYEVHIPIGYETTFRLPEHLHNYFPNNKEANSVNWFIYNADGSFLRVKQSQDDKISSISLTDLGVSTDKNATQEQKRYILSAVRNGTSGAWFPISLLYLVYEPNMKHLTKENVSGDRLESALLSGGRYECIKSIGFENVAADTLTASGLAAMEKQLSGSTQNKLNNIRPKSEDLKLQSFYAFANPRSYVFKKSKRASIGRGEYALYRTLNYPDISKRDLKIAPDGGTYTDYFGLTSEYNKQMVDRLWESSNGTQSGYFMYIDAADEPGVITKIPVELLCSNTTLVVTAWVCDVSSGEPADIGFAFKRKNKDGSETILAKYYTGRFEKVPVKNSSQQQAQWQQVYFRFSFSKNLVTDAEGEYLIEVANNCPSSGGGDYGIDEIKVYRSLPDIDVQREDACTASVLHVSSNYETLRRNMGWDLNSNVLEMVKPDVLNTYKYRKFRYGLMGPTWNTDLNSLDEMLKCWGNIYYGFVKEKVTDASKPGTWITINKHLEGLGINEAWYKSLRVVVPSDLTKFVLGGDTEGIGVNKFPTTLEMAQRSEYIMNVRAIRDFVMDVEAGKWQTAPGNYAIHTQAELYIKLKEALYTKGLWNNSITNPDGTKGAVNIDEILANPSTLGILYERSVVDLFTFLEIPRIRCPWYEQQTGKIHLDALHVENTDLHYANEIYYENGVQKKYDGRYYVVMFNADNILASYDQNPTMNLQDPCTLISEFFVVPSITIAVDTETSSTGVTCVGSIHTMHAKLMVAQVDEYGNVTSPEMVPFEQQYKGHSYTFDWFLGTKQEYDALTQNGRDLQAILADLRNGFSTQVSDKVRAFTVRDVQTSSLNPTEKELLISLMGDKVADPKLVSGSDVSFRWVKTLVAIPFVPDIPNVSNPQIKDKMFCTKPQDFALADELNVPELSLGFSDANYPDVKDEYGNVIQLFNAPLRLGLRHIKSGLSLTNIPIRKDIHFGVPGSGHSLQALPVQSGKPNVKPRAIYLRHSQNVYEEVATLDGLYVDMDDTNDQTHPNCLSLHFNQNVASFFQEGDTCALYIKFGEFDQNNQFIPNSCEGMAVMLVKIVPEFLTWNGNVLDAWYNDSHWKQSTEAELYKGAKRDVDANGTDNVNQALAPLYFTKITLPNGHTMELEKIQPVNHILPLDETRASQHIQYDMAVDTVKQAIDGQSPYTIVPYYINKVSEIYFKPQAQLRRQHHLTYDTARVEFEMKKDQRYWMASPLQDVYAGDMYAPKQTALQHTYAFDPIGYSGGTGVNDRQNPAFYQKAWDKAVDVYTDAPGTVSQEYKVVQSNWSVEYNDVNVPYTLGKGFSISVEDFTNSNQTALVRLPKADKNYTYEPLTKAMSSLAQKSRGGRLADDSSITVILTDEDRKAQWGTDKNIADGDGSHFLLGNPYMYPLDIQKFLNANPVLEKKFWTLSADGTASVGTPDLVDAQGQWTAGSNAITIAPMQAFFVELVKPLDATTTRQEVKFTTDMMAGEPTQTVTTRAAVRATHPLLRLTAEKEGMRSVAYLAVRDDARMAYEKDKDVVTLLDNELTDIPQVYTIAGDRAVGVNAVNRIDNIPLGLFAAEGDEVTLIIEGLSSLLGSVALYDAESNQEKLLSGDSYTIDFTGASHGRYFLRSDASPIANEQIADEAISIYSVAPGKVTISATSPLEQVQLFSVDGHLLRGAAPYQMAITLPVPSGTICLVRAVTAKTSKTIKLQVP